ncbi:MAG: hypothetical protein JXQ73_12500 [Phycisphaerae bacterium]|nr:hypothetical protein [Phycisphaerae bacterium]
MVEEVDSLEPLGDKELPQDDDLPRDDDQVEMVRCPHCGKLIYDETVKCPHCEQWIIDNPKNEYMRSKWFWPIIIATTLVMILLAMLARYRG